MVHLFVALLMAVQLVTFLGMRFAIEDAAQRSMREELQVGSRVFDRILLTQGQQLGEAASVLSADFGFRDAVASRDRKTVRSALVNHADRYKTSRMALVDLNGIVMADSLVLGNEGRRFPLMDLMSTQTGVERGPAIRLLDGKPHQVVVVPVRAPLTIAWVAMMLAIDDATARDLERLVNAGVAFAVQDASSTRVVATTLATAGRNALVEQLPEVIREGRTGMRLPSPGATYQTLARPLDESGDVRIHAILLRATEDATAPFRVLEVIAMLLAGFALAFTLGGAMRIAHRISVPVTKLGETAREIAQGNYEVRAGNGEVGEIADASRALNQIARGLVERELMKGRLGRVREQRDDLARISKDLVHQAGRDTLTGLANGPALALHMAAWAAERRPLAALAIDVDNLARINERFSRDVGDRVLQVLGALIHAIGRPGDLAAREDGDKFVVAIPDPTAALATAERLRGVVEAYPWYGISKDLTVTVSIGLAESQGLDTGGVVERARAACAKAKEEGRNLVRAKL